MSLCCCGPSCLHHHESPATTCLRENMPVRVLPCWQESPPSPHFKNGEMINCLCGFHYLSVFLTSRMWSPGASLPSRAAMESLAISWMTMFPRGVSLPPTMRRPSSSSGSSRSSSTTLASATRLDLCGVLSAGTGVRQVNQMGVWFIK